MASAPAAVPAVIKKKAAPKVCALRTPPLGAARRGVDGSPATPFARRLMALRAAMAPSGQDEGADLHGRLRQAGASSQRSLWMAAAGCPRWRRRGSDGA